MVPACASCGAPLTGEARFCSSCGAPVRGSAGAREARKVVTALFADVVGSTSLGERLDPEDFKSIVGDAVTRMADAVAEFGGAVSEYAGDGLMALFGAPVAHEDDAERAVLAGLRIVESANELSQAVARDWGIEEFAVRVGIETGLAVLGPVGGGGRVEYGAVGDALNTAARLQTAADPGTVLVGGETQRSIAELFEWGEPLTLALKGKADAVTAYPVVARLAAAEASVPLGVRSEIVGRERELEEAIEAIARLRVGSGGIVFVSGDAGIGKSRLVAEMRSDFEGGEEVGLWLEGRCVSYGESLPYWPLRIPVRDQLLESTPEHAEVLSAMLGSGDAGTISALAADAPRLIGDAVAGALAEHARRGPVVLVLEDVHWADASTLALLRRLFELVETEPVLLVLTTRPERAHESWRVREDALRELPHRALELQLSALGSDANRGLLAALVGSAALPAELERRLLERAEGNPFYLEELVRSLVAAGALVEREGSWSFESEIPVELPKTVEKVILARIDRLSPGAHDVLGLASVLGRQFPVDLLEAVAGGSLDPAALRELERAELVRDAGRRPIAMLSFNHTLIQEAAYRSLLKRHRQEVHGRAADALEELFEERIDEFLGMLAHHAGAAGDDARELGYRVRAGDAALRVHAVPEAADHYTEALRAGGRLGLADSEQPLRHAALHRGRLGFDAGRPEESRRDLERALEGATEAGDVNMQVEALLSLVTWWRAADFDRANELLDRAARLAEEAETSTEVEALGRLSIQYSNQLRFDRALDVGERAMGLIREHELGDAMEVVALDALKLVALQLGDIERLDRYTGRLIRILAADRSDRTFYLHWVLLEAAFVDVAACRWEEAIERLDEALAQSRRGGTRMHESLFIDALCWTHRSRGDYERAIAAGREASEAAHTVEHLEWRAWADATLGWALAESGDADEAASVLERGLAVATEGGIPAATARCTCLLAWVQASRGELEASRGLASRGDELLGRVATPPGRAWLFGAHAYVALARAHLAAGDPARALETVEPVLGPARESGWLEAVASVALVAAHARRLAGDEAAARALFAEALQAAETGGMPAPMREAAAALAT